MKKIGILANCTKPRAADVLQRVVNRARELGIAVYTDKTTAQLLTDNRAVVVENMLDVVDAVVALGGDGTMLRAVRELDGRDKPVLGVNIGGLGFLTSVAEEEIDTALESFAAGRLMHSEYLIAECEVERNGKALARYRAMNDVVVSRGATSRVVTLDLAIDGKRVTSYVCDGLIVATPVGSTGHSLSAGGPILVPETSALVISLICPHTLSSRPLVVPDTSNIEIVAAECSGQLLLSVDGQVIHPLLEGDRVKVRSANKGVRLLHLPGYDYFAVLRKKLHWRGSSTR